MKKKLGVIMTVLTVLVGSIGMAFAVNAEEDKKNYPMYDPQVKDTKNYVYGPTIRVNQFSGCIWGCSVLSPRADIEKMMGGFTPEEGAKGGEPILYVADHYDDSAERKLINETAAKFGGSVVCALDMQLFKFNGKDNIRFEEISSPIQLIIGIPDKANYVDLWDKEGEREFAMLRVHGGKVDILKDTDVDVKTLTFTTDKFSIYAMVYAPKGNIDAYLGQTADTETKGSDKNSGDELDKVPKMGDIAEETRLTYGMGRRR